MNESASFAPSSSPPPVAASSAVGPVAIAAFSDEASLQQGEEDGGGETAACREAGHDGDDWNQVPIGEKSSSFPGSGAFARLASAIASKVSLTSSPDRSAAGNGVSPPSPRERRRRKSSRSPSRPEAGRGSSRSPSSSLHPSATTTPNTSPTPSRNRTPSPRSSAAGGSAAQAGADSNRLRVPPRAFLGAIPRQPPVTVSASPSNDSTPSGTEHKRCFCGYYSESPGGRKSGGRCRFCRSRAKYIPGQRSFDTSRFFGSRRRAEPRRAISEDRRSDGQSAEDTSASSSSATTASSSFDRPSPSSSLRPNLFFSTPPFLRRQDRLEVDPPSPNLLTVPANPLGGVGSGSAAATTQGRDHGLRTPPAPPAAASSGGGASLASGGGLPDAADRHLSSHMMAHEMPDYLVPPPRTTPALLGRAHTDPASLYDSPLLLPSASSSSVHPNSFYSASSASSSRPTQPSSPPPSYSEAVKEAAAATSPRTAPPSYEEALISGGGMAGAAAAGASSSASVASPSSVRHRLVPDHLRLAAAPHGRSLSEERTVSTGAPASSSHFPRVARVPPGRVPARPLLRSSRAEDIPDIYWEQAARELDFCTCRKCQARYRQYFEEDPGPMADDAMIPMETQVLMQEVLTDGMAFCSLM